MMGTKFDVERGASKAANIWNKIGEAVRVRGGTERAMGILDLEGGIRIIDELADKLVQAEREEAGGGYFITVNYGKLLADAIAACGCGYNNPDITATNFPCDLVGRTDIEIILKDFGRNIESDEAVAELDRTGFRPANLWELLAFGAKYPQVQIENPIIALGSVWSHSDDLRRVPYLGHWDSQRVLNLDGWQDGWARHYRFAVVRKVPKAVTFDPWTLYACV